MAIGGLGFGVYMAVDLALVADVLPDTDHNAKNLGVTNIAGALPSSIAPAIAPVILAISSGSYGVLYAVAGICAIIGGAAILPVKRVRWTVDINLGWRGGWRLAHAVGPTVRSRMAACSSLVRIPIART